MIQNKNEKRATMERIGRMHLEEGCISRASDILDKLGFSRRTKVSREIRSAMENLVGELSVDEIFDLNQALEMQLGENPSPQLKALEDFLGRHGLAHLLPEQKIHAIKR